MNSEIPSAWELFAEPGAVFRFLNNNRVEFEIDMGTMPPLNLVSELMHLAKLMRKNPKSASFRALSDLTALIVAAAEGETHNMFAELVVRDQMAVLEKELEGLSKDSTEKNN
jgi:hypothetical protein